MALELTCSSYGNDSIQFLSFQWRRNVRSFRGDDEIFSPPKTGWLGHPVPVDTVKPVKPLPGICSHRKKMRADVQLWMATDQLNFWDPRTNFSIMFQQSKASLHQKPLESKKLSTLITPWSPKSSGSTEPENNKKRKKKHQALTWSKLQGPSKNAKKKHAWDDSHSYGTWSWQRIFRESQDTMKGSQPFKHN